MTFAVKYLSKGIFGSLISYKRFSLFSGITVQARSENTFRKVFCLTYRDIDLSLILSDFPYGSERTPMA
jgi:hypothetical protein